MGVANMKIRDLPNDEAFAHVRFIYPGDGKPYYWYSQWNKGVWGKKEQNSQQIFPLFVDELKQAMGWEVVEE
jgi:hypothetical protein